MWYKSNTQPVHQILVIVTFLSPRFKKKDVSWDIHPELLDCGLVSHQQKYMQVIGILKDQTKI